MTVEQLVFELGKVVGEVVDNTTIIDTVIITKAITKMTLPKMTLCAGNFILTSIKAAIFDSAMKATKSMFPQREFLTTSFTSTISGK